MGQHKTRLTFEQARVNRCDAPVHGVGGGHGGQADEKPIRPPLRHQSMGEHHGRFGLASAGDIFEQVNPRPGGQVEIGSPVL